MYAQTVTRNEVIKITEKEEYDNLLFKLNNIIKEVEYESKTISCNDISLEKEMLQLTLSYLK